MIKDPEINLLIACSRIKTTPENQINITKYAAEINDWQKFIYLASAHRVAALVYTSLKKTCPDVIPREVLNHLGKMFKNSAVWNLSISTRLLKILDLFTQNNIQAIPFKGPLLAEKAYKDLNLRAFGDLDILIKKENVITAQNLLLQNGFTAEIIFSPQRLKKYLEYENSLSFYGANNVSIDLHWELTGRYLLKPVYFETLENRLESISFLGKPVFSIPDDVMLVYLSLHGTSHCWEQLEWLCCFVELAKWQKEETILAALDFAKIMGAKRTFLLGLYLGQELLDLNYPKVINQEIVSDKNLIKCAKIIFKQIFVQKTYSSGDAAWRFSPVHILIRDSWKDRLRYFIYLFTAPTIKEWSQYKIPLWLTPLYRVIRPIRLVVIYLFSKMFGSSYISSLFARYREMIGKQKALQAKKSSRFFLYVPGRFVEKFFSTCVAMVNKHFYNKFINAGRLNRFHKKHKHKMTRHFYVISMPGKIHFLEPCIDMIHDHINLFIILNGVTRNEKKSIAVKYPEIPLFELKSLFNRPISHGEVINLLLGGNETNFGLIDHDLYIFNKDIFTRLDFQEDEYIAGPFALHNKKADITFPATFFLFINTKIVKKIMARYRIGAQIYSKIPSRLQPALKKMNLGYDNFLKDYLHYFDPFNMIFAMAAYEGYKAKILKMQKEDMLHLGGKTTDDLLHHPRKTQQLIESIQNKTKNSRK